MKKLSKISKMELEIKKLKSQIKKQSVQIKKLISVQKPKPAPKQKPKSVQKPKSAPKQKPKSVPKQKPKFTPENLKTGYVLRVGKMSWKEISKTLGRRKQDVMREVKNAYPSLERLRQARKGLSKKKIEVLNKRFQKKYDLMDDEVEGVITHAY